ncbi:hypothetical protein [Psychrobacillus sp. OK032]|uniref:hypothetical protein n=1 Tax=Psychrobacillus sp. OK032 TaxID=1884358 RepID=UPI0015A551B9|nr:hypothetical protein [Psychrobacillus sp. OK032]
MRPRLEDLHYLSQVKASSDPFILRLFLTYTSPLREYEPDFHLQDLERRGMNAPAICIRQVIVQLLKAREYMDYTLFSSRD